MVKSARKPSSEINRQRPIPRPKQLDGQFSAFSVHAVIQILLTVRSEECVFQRVKVPPGKGRLRESQSERRRRSRIRRSLGWKGSRGDSAKLQAVMQMKARRG